MLVWLSLLSHHNSMSACYLLLNEWHLYLKFYIVMKVDMVDKVNILLMRSFQVRKKKHCLLRKSFIWINALWPSANLHDNKGSMYCLLLCLIAGSNSIKIWKHVMNSNWKFLELSFRALILLNAGYTNAPMPLFPVLIVRQHLKAIMK